MWLAGRKFGFGFGEGLARTTGVAILGEVVLKRSVRGIAHLLRRSRNSRRKLQLEVCTEAR